MIRQILTRLPTMQVYMDIDETVDIETYFDDFSQAMITSHPIVKIGIDRRIPVPRGRRDANIELRPEMQFHI